MFKKKTLPQRNPSWEIRERDGTSTKTDEKSEPVYVTKTNFLSLLNIGDMIEESGSMRNCFEGENESYIQNIKREISTMKHAEQYLQTILTKMLRMNVLNSLNEKNSITQTKKNDRTSRVRIYKKGQKYVAAEDVFSHEDIVSGVISKAGNLLVCFEESHGKGIKVYPLIFSDEIGSWKFNLWYSETVPQNQHSYVY